MILFDFLCTTINKWKLFYWKHMLLLEAMMAA